MEDIDVFYMDPTFIDLQVYSLWLEGLSGKTNKSLKQVLKTSLSIIFLLSYAQNKCE